MRRSISWMATLVVPFLLLVGPAAAQKKMEGGGDPKSRATVMTSTTEILKVGMALAVVV